MKLTSPVGPLNFSEDVAREFIAEVSAPVEEASAITEDAALQNNLFTKIRFSWRPEDRSILDRIKIAGDAEFADTFTDAITVVDHFYEQLRVPEQNEHGMVKLANGRPVWLKDDSTGKYVERWSQLTGQDVEYTLAKLHQLKMQVAPRVNQLMLEAMYARMIPEDVADDTWGEIAAGTQSDKSARVKRENRTDRYHAFLRFYLYSTANTFLKEIEGFIKTLGNIRYWQVQSQR